MNQDEAVAYYFIRAWATWNQADRVSDWMERGLTYNQADTYLYQAVGLAGLPWPQEWSSPRQQ